MSWVYLALISHFFWALVNIGDKYVLSNRIKSPIVYMVWLAQLGIWSLVLVPFIDFHWPNVTVILLIALAGAVYFFGGIPYFKAVRIEEISRINIWWNLIPVFSLVIAWLTLGEVLSNLQLVAFAILLIGAFIASLKSSEKKMRISRALWLMILAAFSFSVYVVIFRYVTNVIPFIHAFVILGIAQFLLSFTLFASSKFRRDYVKSFSRLDKSLIASVIAVTLFDSLGILFNTWALSLGPAALVAAISGSQVLIVFILVWLISKFDHKLLREKFDFTNVALKVAAIILMATAVFVININS